MKNFAEVARAGDPLCRWGFAEAGKAMAKHLTAISPSAHEVTYLTLNLIMMLVAVEVAL